MRVNAVCPGFTDTEMVRDESLFGGDFMDSVRRHSGTPDLTWECYRRSTVKQTALRRLIDAEEVVEMTVPGISAETLDLPDRLRSRLPRASKLAHILTLTGGCSTSLRGFELAASMVARGEVEYAVVVGADTILEPLYLSATGYAGRSGHRASSISDDPADVRPHDAVQTGNAPAEGAAATVLTSTRHPGGGVDTGLEFIGFSSRNGGGNPMGLGDPKRCAADIRRLLAVGGVSLGDLAFFCDFAEGNRQLEDFLCETLVTLRAALADDAPLTLTSQEACYGHLPGAAGLLKVLASLVMLTENRVAPTANLVNPYPRLPARALAGSSERIADSGRRTAMTVGLSGGGDTTSLLLRLA